MLIYIYRYIHDNSKTCIIILYNKGNVEQDIISSVGRVSVVFVVCNISIVSNVSIVGNVSIVRNASIVRNVSSVSDVSKK